MSYSNLSKNKHTTQKMLVGIIYIKNYSFSFINFSILFTISECLIVSGTFSTCLYVDTM